MRIVTISVMVMAFFVACENPGENTTDQLLYKGQVVQTEQAPFLLNSNSLAKVTEGYVVIDESVPVGTVYGLETAPDVYAAEGGEVLPKDTWVENVTAQSIQAVLTSKITVVFETVAMVTVMDAVDMKYIDADGHKVTFSGSGVIEAKAISTGKDGSVTFISNIKFSIGGEGGDFG